MGDRILRLPPMQEKVLDDLIAKGFFRTKSEAMRMALLEIGKQYGVFNPNGNNGDGTIMLNKEKNEKA